MACNYKMKVFDYKGLKELAVRRKRKDNIVLINGA